MYIKRRREAQKVRFEETAVEERCTEPGLGLSVVELMRDAVRGGGSQNDV